MKKTLFTLFGLFLAIPSLATPPLGLPETPIPIDNPQLPTKIDLGKRLFFDKRFSADGSISCAHCHQASKGFADGLTVAQGIKNQQGTRNSPSIINTAYYDKLFLDGRRDSLEQQVIDPFINAIEHGLESYQPIIAIIQHDPSYPSQFQQVFAINSEVITIEHVAKSLASYVRTLTAGNSAFDRYLFGRDKSALSASAARGLKVFRRKGNCANCHEISWDHALFTDNRFYNIGIGMATLKKDTIDLDGQGKSLTTLKLTALQQSELGRFNVTGLISDIGKFKTPSLRNIALTAPYMHNGSQKTLLEVVQYYNKGGQKNWNLDAAIYPLHLNPQEQNDLVAFMQALTSPTFNTIK